MSDARQFPGWLPPWFFPAPGPTYLKVERKSRPEEFVGSQ